MSSEKPFWEGKTCKEMAGLHIKVTFKNGDVATGVADKNGDIKSAYVLTLGMGDDLFVPEADIESIELVDDPEYERIDDIHDVCTGDIFVATNGNRFSVVAVDDDDETDCTLAVMVQAEIPDFHDWMFNSNFAYALRRKPKLPNHDGLWLDKDDAIWQVCDHQAVPVYDDADEWGLQREIFLVSQLVQHAPFRPGKGGGSVSNRIVKLPSVESFGRLTPDKWLLLKTLEEAAEMVEAGKQYLKASDPTDPSGIGREFDDHANCLACFGVNVGGELGDDRDKAKAGWIGYVRDQRRQAMLGELADVLQTVGNLITAFDITDEELAQSMDDCLVRNQERGRL